MDDAIGRVRRTLEQLQLLEHTLFIFVSDNGAQSALDRALWHGAHGPYSTMGSNKPLRDWKGSIYEGGIRVPALVHWQGQLPPRLVNDVVSAIDILPTVAGVAVPAAMQVEGKNVWPALRGAGAVGARTLYWDTGKAGGIRVGDWKLIETYATGRLQLFNVQSDPFETQDQAATRATQARSLRDTLHAMMANDPP